jgi:nucleoside-diphosphate-sugar epimerase
VKICVTGITGFVGGAAANYFADRGHSVIGIGRKKRLPQHINQKCEYIKSDITKPLHPFDADVVIHAAGLASDKAGYDSLHLTNVIGTDNVLKALKSASCFIYISSSSVYNFNIPVATEKDAGGNFNSLSAYGKTKFLAEKLVLNSRDVQNKFILRPRAIYGVNDSVLLPRLLRLVKTKVLVLPAHLTKNISLTHIDNLLAAINSCVRMQTPTPLIINVADKEIYNLNHILTILLPAVTNQKLKVLKVPCRLWEVMIYMNELIRFNSSLTRFATSSLTKDAVLNIDTAYSALEYAPVKNFDNSYLEIAKWINNTGGWKTYLRNIDMK